MTDHRSYAEAVITGPNQDMVEEFQANTNDVNAMPIVIRAGTYTITDEVDDKDPLKQYERQLEDLKTKMNNEKRVSTTLRNQLQWANDIQDLDRVAPETARQKIQSDNLIANYGEAIAAVELKMANIRALQDAHKNTLPQPDFTIVTMDANNRPQITQKPNIPRLDYADLKTIPRMTSTNNVNITEVIKKLVSHSNDADWGEDNFKSALGTVLAGDHFETFDIHKHRPVSEIIEILAKTYASGHTMPERQILLDSFRRKTGEILSQAMARYENLLAKVEIAYPLAKRQAMKEAKMETTLEANCSKEALICIRKKKQQALQRGTHLDYQEVLKIATEHELNNGYHHQNVIAFPSMTSNGFNQDRPSRQRSQSRHNSIDRVKHAISQSPDMFTNSPHLSRSSSVNQSQDPQPEFQVINDTPRQRSQSRSPTRNQGHQQSQSQRARHQARHNGERSINNIIPGSTDPSRNISSQLSRHPSRSYQPQRQGPPTYSQNHRTPNGYEVQQQRRRQQNYNNYSQQSNQGSFTGQRRSNGYNNQQSQSSRSSFPPNQGYQSRNNSRSYQTQQSQQFNSQRSQPQYQSSPSRSYPNSYSQTSVSSNRGNYRGQNFDPRKARGGHRLDQSITFHGPPEFQQNWSSNQTRSYNVNPINQGNQASKNQRRPQQGANY